MVSASATLVASLAMFGAGCSPTHTFPYSGSWLGHRKLTPLPGTDPHVVDEVSRLFLTLKPDGTFTMSDAGMSKEGSYEIEDGHAVLKVDMIADRPMSHQDEETQKRNVPIIVTPVAGKLKFYDPDGFDREGLLLQRLADQNPKK
jgi:hypothetical protein